jgi:ferritin-like protein
MALSYHEPTAELSPQTRDIHRALATLIEELEAVDWYHQRVDVSDDEELKRILVHNRDEEIEHAAMALEWLRRKMPEFDEELRTYLFTSEPITQIEDVAKQGSDSPVPETGDRDALGIGKLEN